MIMVQEIKELIPAAVTAGLRPEAVDSVLLNVATASRNHWVKLAGDDPSSFSGDYIRGIQNVSMRPGTAIIALVGEIPHLLENGVANEDMRDFLLGPDVPTVPVGERGKHQNKAGGHYRAIPFRHMTPGTKGKTAGRAMGSPYSGHDAVKDSKKLGRDIYAAAKALSATRTAPGGAKAYGGRLKAGTAGAVPSRPHHKTDIYAGMIREEKVYEKATQSKYVTFRTISTTAGTGWMRTIVARHFAQKVGEFAADSAKKAFMAFAEAK